MRIIECGEQGSADWLHARCGKITASRVKDVINYLAKGGEGSKRRDYKLDLVAERMTGMAEESFVSSEMRWGTENEQFARAAYELKHDVLVDKVGFVLHPSLDFFGGSPDGLIGKNGGLELKCPKSTTHLKWIMDGVIPEEHEAQCVANMICCEREWWDFASFDPRMIDEDMQLFTIRIYRDSKRISQIEDEVIKFNDEVEEMITKLQSR